MGTYGARCPSAGAAGRDSDRAASSEMLEPRNGDRGREEVEMEDGRLEMGTL